MLEQIISIDENEWPQKDGFQKLAEYEAAVSQAWGELALDPTLNGNPAFSCSGTTCCACY
jgi:hypothetical protein